MRAHLLDANGVITNTIVIDSLDLFPDWHLVDASIGGQIGDSIVNGIVVPLAGFTVSGTSTQGGS
jgi:hypothetical protein